MQCLLHLDFRIIVENFPSLLARERNGQAPPESLSTISDAVSLACSFYSDSFFVLDGLDECPYENTSRNKLLNFIGDILGIKNSRTLLFSRNETDIQKFTSERLFGVLPLETRDWKLKEDMRIHIRKELGRKEKWGKLREDIHYLIEERLLRDSGHNT